MQATKTCVPDDPAAMGAAIDAMELPDVDAFIDQATDPGVPLAVFLAALDRYSVLTRATIPVRRTLEDETHTPAAADA